MRQLDRDRANSHKLRSEGLSISQIAERLNRSRGAVSAWVHNEGEWYEERNCQLCGVPFRANSGRHRFCSRAHQEKYARLYLNGRRPKEARYLERIRQLEAQVLVLREALARYEER